MAEVVEVCTLDARRVRMTPTAKVTPIEATTISAVARKSRLRSEETSFWRRLTARRPCTPRRGRCGSAPAGRACAAAGPRGRRPCASRPDSSCPRPGREGDPRGTTPGLSRKYARRSNSFAVSSTVSPATATSRPSTSTTTSASSRTCSRGAGSARRRIALILATSSRGEKAAVDVVVGPELETGYPVGPSSRAVSIRIGTGERRRIAGRPRSRPSRAGRCRARGCGPRVW